jgi:hypothetical protein
MFLIACLQNFARYSRETIGLEIMQQQFCFTTYPQPPKKERERERGRKLCPPCCRYKFQETDKYVTGLASSGINIHSENIREHWAAGSTS